MIHTLSAFLVASAVFCGTAAAQQASFADVVGNLRNPDPKVRLSAVKLLHAANYPDAIVPVAALVSDPVNAIQLEAIAAELSFFLVEDVPEKTRVALLVDVRHAGRAPFAFEMGPLGVWPREAPAEVVAALLKAIDDEHAQVRSEAIYALGTIARPPVADDTAQGLVKALDHSDPNIRAAAARVIGRLQVRSAGDALIKAINDSNDRVRYASMRALGQLRAESAVQALTEQLKFYGKGEGALSALDGLARIGHPSSVDLFTARLQDKDPFMRRAAAEGLGRASSTSAIDALAYGVSTDDAEPVRAAMAFALVRLGQNYLGRLADGLDRPGLVQQVSDYLLELGPPAAPGLRAHLQDPSDDIRKNTARVLGAIGGTQSLPLLQPLLVDRDKQVVQAATRAIERIKMQ